MMRFPGSSLGNSARSSWLPGLVGVLLAMVFWLLADDAREKLEAVESQADATGMTSRRLAVGDQIGDLKERLRRTRVEKDMLTARLQTMESAQMVRARLIFDLRQKCAATGATACSVRLADDSIGASKPNAAGDNSVTPAISASREGGQPRLADLGVLKARAIVSGQFQGNEVSEFSKHLDDDPTAHWRINGLVVRDRSFEFDVERHIIEKMARGS